MGTRGGLGLSRVWWSQGRAKGERRGVPGRAGGKQGSWGRLGVSKGPGEGWESAGGTQEGWG